MNIGIHSAPSSGQSLYKFVCVMHLCNMYVCTILTSYGIYTCTYIRMYIRITLHTVLTYDTWFVHFVIGMYVCTVCVRV